MSTDAAKLACFEGLADLEAGEPPLAEAAPDAAAPPDSVPLPPATPDPVPTAPAEAVAEAAAAPAPAAAEDRADDFGREYLEDEDDEEASDTLTATVNEVTADRTKRLVFRFANGQVWRQLEPRRFQYPRREAFDVVISRGVLGDYQLRVGGKGRMTRIKRIK